MLPIAATSFAVRATFLWNPDDPSLETPTNLANLRKTGLLLESGL
jgi:hypothetical protein